MADNPTGWWLLEFFTPPTHRFRTRSAEELAAVQRIGYVWVATFIGAQLAVYVAKKVLRLNDDLSIYFASSLLLTIPASLWLARRIFVWRWPQLSAVADTKASQRIAAEEARRTD